MVLTKELYDEIEEGENYYFILKSRKNSDVAKVTDVSKRFQLSDRCGM